MKKNIFILFAMFVSANMYAQVGNNNCHFNNSEGELKNGKIYEVTRSTSNENKKEVTHSGGVQGNANFFGERVTAGGNYNYSNTSDNNSNTTTTRRGYECCDDNYCTSDYENGKSIYAESKKGKYLKPKK